MVQGIKTIYRQIRRQWINLVYKKAAIRTYKERSEFQDTDYVKICQDIPLAHFKAHTPEREFMNDFYGIAQVLKAYAGIDNRYPIRAHIEHGVFFGTQPWKWEVESPYQSLVLMNPARLPYLSSLAKDAYVIGPYITYAEASVSSEQMQKEKSANGKTLVVFPAHSTSEIESSHDIDEHCQEIEALRKRHNFKTVMVCLYWKDYQDPILQPYQEKGYVCVSAGHFLDPRFLSRLRTIIELSDVTMSNKIGSHIGYSLALQKPHYLSRQTIHQSGPEKIINLEKVEVYGEAELTDAFGTYSENITAKQKKAADYYFGVGAIMKPKELADLITSLH